MSPGGLRKSHTGAFRAHMGRQVPVLALPFLSSPLLPGSVRLFWRSAHPGPEHYLIRMHARPPSCNYPIPPYNLLQSFLITGLDGTIRGQPLLPTYTPRGRREIAPHGPPSHSTVTPCPHQPQVPLYSLCHNQALLDLLIKASRPGGSARGNEPMTL